MKNNMIMITLMIKIINMNMNMIRHHDSISGSDLSYPPIAQKKNYINPKRVEFSQMAIVGFPQDCLQPRIGGTH
jgi:hypothetical protein